MAREGSPRKSLVRRTDPYAGPALAPVSVGGRLGVGLFHDGQPAAIGLTSLTVTDAAFGRGGVAPWTFPSSGVRLNAQAAGGEVLIGPPLALPMTKHRARQFAPMLALVRAGEPPEGALEAIDLLKASVEEYPHVTALVGMVSAVVVCNPTAAGHLLASLGHG